MVLTAFLISFVLSATGVTITEPEDWTAYNLEELPGIRAIVENENVIPDSVHYSLNGAGVIPLPRLSTDWPTYMQNYQNHGYSESPAPHTSDILWSAPVTGNEHEFPTPVVVEGIVYYPQDYGGDSLLAIDAVTGEILWKYKTGETDDAVTVYDGLLYTASDSIWCLDALTGEKIWSFGGADLNGSTPIASNGFLYCAKGGSVPDSSKVYCLDADNGSVVWSSPELYGEGMGTCMALYENIIYTTTQSLTLTQPGRLYALDAGTGEILWENADSDNMYHDSSPTVVDGVLYINDTQEKTFAFDALSGEKIWEQPTGGGTATIAYHEGKLYFANEILSYYCLNVTQGNTIWTSSYAQHGSSAIADGLVFFGELVYPADSARVIALDCDTGELVWSFKTVGSIWGNGFQSSPSVTDGVMYYACTDGYLYAFGTGLKYTYLDETLNPEVGWNELVVTSFDNGVAVASDTTNFYINPTGIEFEPSRRLLLTGSPNPFSSSTELSFSLSEPGFTTVEIFDLSGRCVSSLVESDLPEGNHTVYWGGANQQYDRVPPGLYICRIQSGGVIETTGLCLLR